MDLEDLDYRAERLDLGLVRGRGAEKGGRGGKGGERESTKNPEVHNRWIHTIMSKMLGRVMMNVMMALMMAVSMDDPRRHCDSRGSLS